MKWPRISIIIPSYNQGRFIEETFKSVLDQHYPNLELIVQDGGSTDQTLAILKKYKAKLRYESRKDNGQTQAINNGLHKASGEIIGYLNSDDVLLPGSIHKVAEQFSKNSSLKWLTGQCLIINQRGKPIRSLVKRYKDWWLGRFHYRYLLVGNFICQPATFWRRSMLKKVGGFDEKLQYAMDYDYWLRLAKISPPLILNDPLAAFRIHAQAKTTRQFGPQLAEKYQIVKQFTNNWLALVLHRIHSFVIETIYSFLR